MSSAGGRRQRRETSLIRNCHHLPGRETLQGYLAHKKLPSPWQVDGGSALHLACLYFFFFFTLVTGPSRSLSLKLSDTRVYAPQIQARLGTGGRRQRASPGVPLQGYLAHKKLPSPWQVDGDSALHLACLYGLAPLIGPLIAQGADVTPRNWSEFTLSSW